MGLFRTQVEIAIDTKSTFDSLKNVSASYWLIDPRRYVIVDSHGVHLLSGMTVVEVFIWRPKGPQL